MFFLMQVACLLALFPTSRFDPPEGAIAPLEQIDPAYRDLIALERAYAAILATQARTQAAEKNTSPSPKPSPLAFYRERVNDRQIAPLLLEFRRWLNRPLTLAPPASTFQQPTAMEWMDFSALPDLFTTRIRVLFSEGRVEEALSDARDQVRMARAIQQHSIYGWNTGRELEEAVYFLLAERLNQLSARDCDWVRQWIEELERSRLPVHTAHDREYQSAFARLMDISRRGMTQVETLLCEMPPDLELDGKGLSLEEKKEYEEYANQTRGDVIRRRSLLRDLGPNAIHLITLRTRAQLNKNYHQGQYLLQVPYGKRPPFDNVEDTKKEETLDDLIEEMTTTLAYEISYWDADAHLTAQARMRLLGCHAAVRRYLWEHAKLPASLKQLKLGALARDPFSGQEFVYKVEKGEYTIESIGPFEEDDAGKQSVQRSKITLFLQDEPSTPDGPVEAPLR
jgi:hypothetical protein